MKKLFKIIISRTALLYVGAVILIISVGNFPRAWNHVVTSTLSRYMPAHDYLIMFNRDRTLFNSKKNKEFELYYRKLSELMPQLPDANAMLGFCYFYDGKIGRAKSAYQQAVLLNPQVFNYYYNLGMIALKKNDRADALAYFKKSLDVPVVVNLQFVVTSHVYKPLLPDTKDPEVLAAAMGQYTYDVYRRAYFQILRLAEVSQDYQTLLHYARRGVEKGFLDAGVGRYYAGLGAYGLKEYEAAAGYMQEAMRNNFLYSQAFEVMGLSLQELKRSESVAALVAAVSLKRDQRIFVPAVLSEDLLIY